MLDTAAKEEIRDNIIDQLETNYGSSFDTETLDLLRESYGLAIIEYLIEGIKTHAEIVDVGGGELRIR